MVCCGANRGDNKVEQSLLPGMSARLSPRPEYADPPVSEVVLSVQFLPLAGWRSPHAGWYWSRIGSDYPIAEEHPALPMQIEKFGEELRQSHFVQSPIRVGFEPNTSRFWFIADPSTRLIQIQRDRFTINWRKVTGREIYPRYEDEMRPRFEHEWLGFKDFVVENGLGVIDVQQCEITYVNHIPCGAGWETFSKALSLLSYWSGRGSDGFLPEPETFSMSGSFIMPRDSGRLHFVAQRVIRQMDQLEGLQLQLIARGRPLSGDDVGILAWMDEGRDWIVRGFTDLTTGEAHKLWGRTR